MVKGDDGGAWHQHYNFKGLTLDPHVNEEHPPIFGTGAPEAPGPQRDPLLAPTTEAIARAKQLGREKYRERLRALSPLKHHLAQVVAGLTDNVMTADFPATREEVQPYLKRNETLFALIDGKPTDLSDRVKRLWATYLRARVEREWGV
jgi:hypothetical protein